jgi:hypothetical protein
MLKKMILASAVSMILAGAMVTVAPAPAEAGVFKCREMAKEKFPDDRKARKAYKKSCKAEHKAYKKAHKKGLLGLRS